MAIHRALGEIDIRLDVKYPIRFRFTQLLGAGCKAYDWDNWDIASKIIADAFKRLRLIPDDRPAYVGYPLQADPEEHRDKPCGGVRVEVINAPRWGRICPKCSHVF